MFYVNILICRIYLDTSLINWHIVNFKKQHYHEGVTDVRHKGLCCMQLGHPSQTKHSGWLFGLVAVALLVLLSVLGGTPPDDKMSVFIVGVILTIGGSVLIATIGWHLLIRPLPAGQKVVRKALMTGKIRYVAGLLMILGLVNVAVGSMWDEIWHANYGIPFGEDFFWRPHQLLYFGFIVTIGVAAWGLYAVLKKGEGTLQQRFRSDPVLGLAILSGAYLAFALPADPVWHQIYGVDLSAWSLPHIVLLVMVLVMGVSAAAMQLSTETERQWATLWSKPTWSDFLMVVIFAALLVAYSLVFIVEWYLVAAETADFTGMTFNLAQRPDWLLPALLMLISVFVGGIALFTTRRVGVITLVALLALGARFAVDNVMHSAYSGTIPYVVILPAVLTLDIASYFLMVRQQKPNHLLTTLAITGTFAVIGLPAMNAVFTYPEVTLNNAPMIIAVAFAVTYGGLWMAEVVGDFLRGLEVAEGSETGAIPVARRIWIDGAVYAAFTLFAVFLMLTATPPA
jgi:hypothetical protein